MRHSLSATYAGAAHQGEFGQKRKFRLAMQFALAQYKKMTKCVLRKTITINRKILPILAWLLAHMIVTGNALADDPHFGQIFRDAAPQVSPPVAIKIAELPESMEVFGLDFSPDGKHLAATSIMDSNEIHVWDWQGSKNIAQKLNKGRGAIGPMTEPLRYSPDGRFLVACHSRNEQDIVIHVWDTQTGNLIHNIRDVVGGGGCDAVGFMPDSKWLIRIRDVISPKQDNIFVYDTTSWQLVWSLHTQASRTNTLAISPDGKFAAIGGTDLHVNQDLQSVSHQPQIVIIDLSKRDVVKSIDAFPLENRIERLAWHPNGKYITAGAVVGGTFSGPDIVKVFDAATGDLVVGESVERPAHIYSLRYSPDGRYLVESGINQSIRIWDGQHQTLLQEIHGEAGSLAFSRDGQFLAMGGNKKILIWQMQ